MGKAVINQAQQNETAKQPFHIFNGTPKKTFKDKGSIANSPL